MRILLTALTMLSVVSSLALAQEARDQLPVLVEEGDWNSTARFFGGVRAGMGIPPGGTGVAPTLGIELGVSAPHGFGFGLHVLGMNNPPAISQLGIAKAEWGLGALADLRMYFQTVEPLTVYATLSGGFLAGPGIAGENVVLPLITPGFGARVKVTDTMYVAFEFGAAGFFIPYVNLSVGWEPERKPRKSQRPVEAPHAAQPPQSQGS